MALIERVGEKERENNFRRGDKDIEGHKKREQKKKEEEGERGRERTLQFQKGGMREARKAEGKRKAKSINGFIIEKGRPVQSRYIRVIIKWLWF